MTGASGHPGAGRPEAPRAPDAVADTGVRSSTGSAGHDKVVRPTHGVTCTGSCSWKVYVKDGLITGETQQTEYPLPAAPGTDGALAMVMGHVIVTEVFRDRQAPYSPRVLSGRGRPCGGGLH